MYRYLILTLVFYFVACTPPVTNTLLTNGSDCTTSGNCSQSTSTSQTQIEGSLEIKPDNDFITKTVNDSDMVEITGSCTDLARRENRIIIHGYHREDTTSDTPYIDNTLSSLCQTNAYTGLPNTDQCLFVNEGKSLIDSTAVYPQCFNGRFSFLVKLGNPFKDLAVEKKYKITMKLQTTNPSGESSEVSVLVTRNIGTPSFAVTSNDTYARCEVKMNTAKYKHATFVSGSNPDVRYTLNRSASGFDINGSALTIASAARYSNAGMSLPIVTGDSVASFYDGNWTVAALPPSYTFSAIAAEPLVPGVTYKYAAKALVGTDESTLSSEVECPLSAPWISTANSSAGICYLTLGGGGFDTLSYDWDYGYSSDWSTKLPKGTDIPAACNYSGCAFDMTAFASGTTLYVAVRASFGTAYGKWSSTATCTRN